MILGDRPNHGRQIFLMLTVIHVACRGYHTLKDDLRRFEVLADIILAAWDASLEPIVLHKTELLGWYVGTTREALRCGSCCCIHGQHGQHGLYSALYLLHVRMPVLLICRKTLWFEGTACRSAPRSDQLAKLKDRLARPLLRIGLWL